ncbi:MATE family efflux transporter [Mycoplasmopsis columboralis]|nr:MATE family efflux transporter [Mycoplasmopsis columboralis]
MKAKTNKNSRAEELFARTPISKSIWIVVIPSLMIAFMIGLYSFMDQVFIQQFVPDTKIILSNNQVGEISKYLPSINTYSLQDYTYLLNKYNSIAQVSKIVQITANSVVSTSNAATQPLIIFSNSIVFLVPVGASVYYTKCLSKKLNHTAKNLWASMFWVTAAFCLSAGLIVIILTASGVLNLLAGKTIINTDPNTINGVLTSDELQRLQDYYDGAFSLSVHWAKQYIYIYAAGTILQGLVAIFSYFIRAEGFNAYTMIISITSNLINIALDALFIIVFKMGLLGGVVATIIGWTFNLVSFVIYVWIKNKQKLVLMSLKDLWFFKFNKDLLGPIFSLGLGGFIRTFGVAFSFFILNIVLTKTVFADPGHYQFYWSKTSPIISLFLISVFGISDGARSLLSYNYTRRDFKHSQEVYKWVILISIIYAVVIYVFIALTADNLWMIALNVDKELIPQTANFIRVMTLRIVITSMTICSILAFQGTNSIERSLFATALENFITFIVIVPIGFGFATLGYQNTSSVDVANWIILSTFIVNALVAAVILFVISWRYMYKTLPNIDNNKLTWSKKIEHAFFDKAQKQEELLQMKNNEKIA